MCLRQKSTVSISQIPMPAKASVPGSANTPKDCCNQPSSAASTSIVLPHGPVMAKSPHGSFPSGAMSCAGHDDGRVSQYCGLSAHAPYCVRYSSGDGGTMVGKPLEDGMNVLLVDDVMTAGTAVREVVPKLKAQADADGCGLWCRRAAFSARCRPWRAFRSVRAWSRGAPRVRGRCGSAHPHR